MSINDNTMPTGEDSGFSLTEEEIATLRKPVPTIGSTGVLHNTGAPALRWSDLSTRGDLEQLARATTDALQPHLGNSLDSRDILDEGEYWLKTIWPSYGNYGGGLYSAGKYTLSPQFTAPPVDDLDTLFMLHDLGYVEGRHMDADAGLLNGIDLLRKVGGTAQSDWKQRVAMRAADNLFSEGSTIQKAIHAFQSLGSKAFGVPSDSEMSSHRANVLNHTINAIDEILKHADSETKKYRLLALASGVKGAGLPLSVISRVERTDSTLAQQLRSPSDPSVASNTPPRMHVKAIRGDDVIQRLHPNTSTVTTVRSSKSEISDDDEDETRGAAAPERDLVEDKESRVLWNAVMNHFGIKTADRPFMPPQTRAGDGNERALMMKHAHIFSELARDPEHIKYYYYEEEKPEYRDGKNTGKMVGTGRVLPSQPLVELVKDAVDLELPVEMPKYTQLPETNNVRVYPFPKDLRTYNDVEAFSLFSRAERMRRPVLMVTIAKDVNHLHPESVGRTATSLSQLGYSPDHFYARMDGSPLLFNQIIPPGAKRVELFAKGLGGSLSTDVALDLQNETVWEGNDGTQIGNRLLQDAISMVDSITDSDSVNSWDALYDQKSAQYAANDRAIRGIESNFYHSSANRRVTDVTGQLAVTTPDIRYNALSIAVGNTRATMPISVGKQAASLADMILSNADPTSYSTQIRINTDTYKSQTATTLLNLVLTQIQRGLTQNTSSILLKALLYADQCGLKTDPGFIAALSDTFDIDPVAQYDTPDPYRWPFSGSAVNAQPSIMAEYITISDYFTSRNAGIISEADAVVPIRDEWLGNRNFVTAWALCQLGYPYRLFTIDPTVNTSGDGLTEVAGNMTTTKFTLFDGLTHSRGVLAHKTSAAIVVDGVRPNDQATTRVYFVNVQHETNLGAPNLFAGVPISSAPFDFAPDIEDFLNLGPSAKTQAFNSVIQTILKYFIDNDSYRTTVAFFCGVTGWTSTTSFTAGNQSRYQTWYHATNNTTQPAFVNNVRGVAGPFGNGNDRTALTALTTEAFGAGPTYRTPSQVPYPVYTMGRPNNDMLLALASGYCVVTQKVTNPRSAWSIIAARPMVASRITNAVDSFCNQQMLTWGLMTGGAADDLNRNLWLETQNALNEFLMPIFAGAGVMRIGYSTQGLPNPGLSIWYTVYRDIIFQRLPLCAGAFRALRAYVFPSDSRITPQVGISANLPVNFTRMLDKNGQVANDRWQLYWTIRSIQDHFTAQTDLSNWLEVSSENGSMIANFYHAYSFPYKTLIYDANGRFPLVGNGTLDLGFNLGSTNLWPTETGVRNGFIVSRAQAQINRNKGEVIGSQATILMPTMEDFSQMTMVADDSAATTSRFRFRAKLDRNETSDRLSFATGTTPSISEAARSRSDAPSPGANN